MVKLIMGLKGSGKTKKLVDLVREAVNEGHGDVVCIERERKLTYDIPYQARLIDAGAYAIGSYEFMKGLLSGIHAGNYDITHVFIDNFYKLVDDRSAEELEKFVDWLDDFSARENVEFVLSISRDTESVSEKVRSHLICSRQPGAVCLFLYFCRCTYIRLGSSSPSPVTGHRNSQP